MDQTLADPFAGFWSSFQSLASTAASTAAGVINNASASNAAQQQQAAAEQAGLRDTLKIIAIGGLVLAGILIAIAAFRRIV